MEYTQTVFAKYGHKIVFGDALEALQEHVADSSVDLVFADPPYNIGKVFNGRRDKWPTEEAYLEWSYGWLDLCLRKLKPHGSFYLTCSTQCFPHFDLYLRKKLTVLSRIVWFYDSSGVQAKRYFGSLWEPILFCVRDPDHYTFNADDIRVEAKTGAQRKLIDYRKPVPTVYNSTKVPGNVWEIPRVRYRMPEYEEHPTQKPVALLERIIKASSNSGDLVLDPFAGTFTTCFVAKELGRRSIGIEIEAPFVKIGLRRLHLATHFNGELLVKPLKTYESAYSEAELAPMLLEK
ncbi:MAG: adenine-specific DNA-methyltransferase [Verrucomicrobia bacterium]|nr:adenine-specific DNA-methyltransferase [Verrucomicrobiota bacterium]